MGKVILVESRPDIRKLISLNLEIYTGKTVIPKQNADEVTEYLKNHPEVELIITCNRVGDENTSLKIVYAVKSQKLSTPILLLGSNPKIAGDVISIEDPDDWKELIKLSARAMAVTAEEMSEKEVPAFYPININHFTTLATVSTDVFEKNDDGEYIKSINSSDPVDIAKIQSKILKGVKELYVFANDRLRFVNHFSEEIIAKLEDDKLNQDDRVKANNAAFDNVKSLLDMVGMNNLAIEMAQATIDSMVSLSEQTSGLSDLLAILRNNPDSFQNVHSQMIACVAQHTISKMEWGNNDQVHKIAFVAFFHDITIPEDDLCKIHTEQELNELEVPMEIYNKVKNHALHAAQLVKDIPQAPFGADSIILQHHGAMNGIGFPEEQFNRVSPLAAIFRVVEEFVDIVMATEPEFFNFEQTIKKLKSKYKNGAYKNAVLGLEQIDK